MGGIRRLFNGRVSIFRNRAALGSGSQDSAPQSATNDMAALSPGGGSGTLLTAHADFVQARAPTGRVLGVDSVGAAGEPRATGSYETVKRCGAPCAKSRGKRTRPARFSGETPRRGSKVRLIGVKPGASSSPAGSRERIGDMVHIFHRDQEVATYRSYPAPPIPSCPSTARRQCADIP